MNILQEKVGITSTVYSWVMPETEKMLRELQKEKHQSILVERHREAWTSKQDSYHKEFFKEWLAWVSPVVITPEEFPYRYPTAGSSEAIRESLAQHASLANYRPHLGTPTIHIFKGEYEGYKALAKPYGIRVVEHNRNKWKSSIKDFSSRETTENHLFYLSNPSSIDGNFWSDFEEFLDYIDENTTLKVMLDLCYVGCVSTDCYPETRLNAGHPSVDTVFFSLSKTFGVYYHRIGGMFSQTKHDGLWGNKWFKNLTSLYLGKLLMKTYGVTELPDKYRPLQKDIVGSLVNTPIMRPKLGGPLCASDVFLLANQDVPLYNGNPKYFENFIRNDRQARYCLTKLMYQECESQYSHKERIAK